MITAFLVVVKGFGAIKDQWFVIDDTNNVKFTFAELTGSRETFNRVSGSFRFIADPAAWQLNQLKNKKHFLVVVV